MEEKELALGARRAFRLERTYLGPGRKEESITERSGVAQGWRGWGNLEVKSVRQVG